MAKTTNLGPGGTTTAKCKKCKKTAMFHVDRDAPAGQHAAGPATVWLCPNCGTTNLHEHPK